MRVLCRALLLSLALHGTPCEAAGTPEPISRGASEITLSHDGTEIVFSLAGLSALSLQTQLRPLTSLEARAYQSRFNEHSIPSSRWNCVDRPVKSHLQ